MRNGQGTYLYQNGDRYSGGWKDDREDGPGRMCFRNGEKKPVRWEKGYRRDVI